MVSSTDQTPQAPVIFLSYITLKDYSKCPSREIHSPSGYVVNIGLSVNCRLLYNTEIFSPCSPLNAPSIAASACAISHLFSAVSRRSSPVAFEFFVISALVPFGRMMTSLKPLPSTPHGSEVLSHTSQMLFLRYKECLSTFSVS